MLTSEHKTKITNLDYKEVIKNLKRSEIPIRILGNPSYLDSEIDFLKLIDLKEYQVSIDGNKETHNSIRGENYSFDRVMEAIDFLNSNNIAVGVMYTLNKNNMKDLKDILDICVEKEIHRFSFDRVVPFGNAKNYELPSSKDYKEFFPVSQLQYVVQQPLSLLELSEKYNENTDKALARCGYALKKCGRIEEAKSIYRHY